jgi:hypothetical protein
LTSETFGLLQNDLISVRIAATNTIGTSPYLTEIGVAVQTVPEAPSAVAQGSQTTEEQIEVKWSLVTDEYESGGTPILSYRLDWDNGTNLMIWTTLIGYESAYDGVAWIQGGCVPGKTYHFRLSVQNAQGWSAYSPVTAVLAANVPA